MSTENALMTILMDKLHREQLVLPTLPEIATQVCKVCEDPGATIYDVAHVVECDPAITARVMRIANSAVFMRSRSVNTLRAALVRIGMRSIRNVAVAIALEQLFNSNNPIINDYLRRVWRQSVAVASAAHAAAYDYLTKDANCDLHGDILMLAALLHEVGALPILHESSLHEDIFANPTFLEMAIEALSGCLGRAVVEHWQLGPPYGEILERWRDPTYATEQISYIDFVRIGAMFHGSLDPGMPPREWLRPYYEKGAISEPDLFNSEAFNQRYDANRAQFDP